MKRATETRRRKEPLPRGETFGLLKYTEQNKSRSRRHHAFVRSGQKRAAKCSLLCASSRVMYSACPSRHATFPRQSLFRCSSMVVIGVPPAFGTSSGCLRV